MSSCKPVPTPLAPHFKLSSHECPKAKEDKDDMSRVSYSSAVGSLMYAMVCTRPDLAHARYWYSSLQAITALSTTEAEYISSTEGVKEAIWLRGMVNELGLPQKPGLLESRAFIKKTSIEPLLIEDEPLDQTFSGHVTNLRLDLSGSHTGSRDRTVFKNDRPIVQAPPGFDTAILKLELLTMLHSLRRPKEVKIVVLAKDVEVVTEVHAPIASSSISSPENSNVHDEGDGQQDETRISWSFGGNIRDSRSTPHMYEYFLKS
ncbi:hypothetical protein Tco_0992416 [Tanacetum coccineum]|uniref:Uncharacterized protein n=1 Tax=Tanacetum coccineum TaxID=301880 RepID=A0ABQ5F2A8_9ASTR